MFERYTERARRVLFCARYEASQVGGVSIESEHLLLGLIREGKGLTARIFARSNLPLEKIRKEIEERTLLREKIPTSVNIPFSAETKRVLQFAAEEADRLLHNYIGTEHLLLGILREERSVAASILIEKGMRLDTVREDVVQLLNAGGADTKGFEKLLTRLHRYLPHSRRVHISRVDEASQHGHPINRAWAASAYSLKNIIAHTSNVDERYVDLPDTLDNQNRYDFVVVLPDNDSLDSINRLLREAIEEQFGIVVTRESRATEAYVLTSPEGPGPALRRTGNPDQGVSIVNVSPSLPGTVQAAASMFPIAEFSSGGVSIEFIRKALEEVLDRPVINETGLSGLYTLELNQPVRNRDTFFRRLREHAGLAITLEQREVSMLVVRQRDQRNGG